MEKKVSKKNIFFVSGLIFILLLSAGSIALVAYHKNKAIQVEAVVKELQSSNMIVADSAGVEYLLPNIDAYNVGDRIAFEMKNLDKDGTFVEGEITRIETISKSVQFIITDIRESEKENVEDNSSFEELSNEKSNEDNVSNSSEEDVIAYFTNLENEIQTTMTTGDITTTLKNSFVTIVDFLFYDGMIKGKTFSELNDTAKLQVLKIAFSIDNKLEEKFPNYKEKINGSGNKIYTNIKAKILETYLNLSVKICESNQEVCETAKEGLHDLKTSFSLTWSFIKEISTEGISNLKSWYEVWRESE